MFLNSFTYEIDYETKVMQWKPFIGIVKHTVGFFEFVSGFKVVQGWCTAL